MAITDKNIVITPHRGGLTAQPEIFFGGSGGVPIRLKVLDDSNGTLSWEGSAGQLFSINNNLTSGSIFSVNDVSGIPSIDVNANGTVVLAGFTGNVGVGVTAPTVKLDVNGTVIGRSGVGIGADAISTRTSGYTLAATDNGKIISFNSGSALVVGIDTAAGATGFSCTVMQLGTGGVRFAGSGVTLNSYMGLSLAGQHAAATVLCYQTNVFNLSGNLVG